MNANVDKDPAFAAGVVIPVIRADCTLPDAIQRPSPLYADLRDDTQTEPWGKLLSACSVDLGVDAPQWLRVRDELRRDLQLGRSVNLVVSGRDLAWRPMIDQLAEQPSTQMTRVELYSARTIERHGLLACMLSENDGAHNLSAAPRDLDEFQKITESRPTATRVALVHFDQVQHRQYGVDYFTTLRYLVTEQRKLVLLIQSRAPFGTLLRPEEQSILSHLDIATIELKGYK